MRHAKTVAVLLLFVVIIAGCHKANPNQGGIPSRPAIHYQVTVTPPLPPDNLCKVSGAPDPVPLSQSNKDDVFWTLAGNGSDTYAIQFDKDSGETSPCDDGVPTLEMHGHGASTAICTVQKVHLPAGPNPHKTYRYSIHKKSGTTSIPCIDPSVDVQE
jgi:hypothetical protein